MGRPKKNPSMPAAYTPKKIQGLEPLEDIVTEADQLWSAILSRLSKLSRVYGFQRVEVPFLEDFRLYENFYRNDPKQLQSQIRLEMSGRPVGLRGDFLPGVLRAYYEHKVYEKS